MKKRILLILFVVVLLAASGAAQRVNVPAGSVSFVRPAFLVQDDKRLEAFHASRERFGVPAFLMFSPPVSLAKLNSKLLLDGFEGLLKTKDYQRELADAYVKGMASEGVSSYSIDNVEYATVLRRPAVRITVSGKIRDVEVKSVALAVFNRTTKKMYYIVWVGPKKSFGELSAALGPVVESIRLR